ncbi:VOC family protein [Rhizobacter sp. OV335]|uniref:VOC family protein n=1 Tax=Rhizobacter sp. OV335 TaxID=1500264 RepID=UPI0009204630|nr:VOC family protein [Rhizobacter sp. OV335]SHM22503.1 Glyoxalase-like domain-containing protein [Rhizobacter sp. OV335]
MRRCQLDHITVTAPTLAQGAAFVRDALGVEMQAGGEHPRMGTHNLLLRLGDSLFLEVIAVNPDAPAPTRPRWFALDTLRPDTPPRLSNWVARTNDIRHAAAAASEALGTVEPITRATLQWLITIPSDGSLPMEGIAPALIEWQAPVHPASRLQDVGCSLHSFEAQHPEPDRVTALLATLGLDQTVRVSPLPAGATPRLVAHIHTPTGLRTIGA